VPSELNCDEPSLVGPAPAGRALSVVVPCRTTTNPKVAPARHAVRIGADWTVEVPHDLSVERIVVALGGHMSCIGLVEEVVPALRYWLGVMLSVRGCVIEPRGSEWLVAGRASCCRDVAYRSAADAAGHARSLPHAANRHGADLDLLAVVAAAARDAYGTAFDLDPADPAIWRASAACRGGITDVAYLHRLGLTPIGIVAIHRSAGAVDALPRTFYLAVAGGAVDPRDGIGSFPGRDDRGFGFDDAEELTGYLRLHASMEGTP